MGRGKRVAKLFIITEKFVQLKCFFSVIPKPYLDETDHYHFAACPFGVCVSGGFQFEDEAHILCD